MEISLDNQGIKQMKLRFYQSTINDYPLGMKEIDQLGGVIDIPGVGHLSIPE